ncbi:MAG: lipoprotein signal peptidase [Bacteroidetes bacterium CG2_30_33_31]|nr:MAG: lipoprotein signal peptidase [Bacteroidetes bacterium CG2_30_33_31]
MKKAVITVLIVLFLDQFIKIWVKSHMEIGDSIPVLGSWFYLHFVENVGMAYGMTIGGSWGKLALSIFRILAIGGIGYYLYTIIIKKYHSLLIISISLIFAGAIGNVLDSAFYGLIFSESGPITLATMFPDGGGYAGFLYGKVVDMFYFPMFEGIWPNWMPFVGGDYYLFFQPVFNIADASISIGVAILIIFQKKFYTGKKTVYTEDEEEI